MRDYYPVFLYLAALLAVTGVAGLLEVLSD